MRDHDEPSPKPAGPIVESQSVRARLSTAGGIFWWAALAVVLLILLHESLFQGKGLVAADGILNYAPWNQKVVPSNGLLTDQELVFLPTQEFVHRQKSLPLWNPYLCCGAPNLGAIQGAMLFPIRLLLSPLDPFAASGPSAFLKLCLAGWFTMLYLRLLGASGAAAFLSGMVFSLSGFMIIWLGHPHVNSAMWLPLLLYAVERSFGEECATRALRVWVVFAIGFACMILGGHPPTTIHVTIVVLIYFLFRLIGSGRSQWWRRMSLLTAAIAVGLLLAAPQILPFLEYYRLSSSALSSATLNRSSHYLTCSSFIHFLLPNALGNPALGFEDLLVRLAWREAANFSERTQYVGIVPLFLAAFAVAQWRCKFTKFFFALAVGCVLVIGGVPPLPSLLRVLPVLGDMNQTRLLLFVGFSVAVLAGLGWDELSRMRTSPRARLVAIRFCEVVGLALLWFFLVTGSNLPFLDAPHRSFFLCQLFILAGGIVATLFLVWWPARWAAWMPMLVCFGWTAIDLLCFGSGFNPALDRAHYYPPTPSIKWLQKDNSLFRIIGAGSVLPPDTAEVFGLNDARGFDFATVRRYEELITGQAGDFFFYESAARMPEALALLNVKYILSASPLATPTSSLELVYSNEISICRNPECRDRALLVYDDKVEPDRAAVLAAVSSKGFDPQKLLILERAPTPLPTGLHKESTIGVPNGTVHIMSYEPDKIKIEASLSRPGWLLLLDTYFPGWTATVNGAPSTILRADYNFRAVALPAGKSTADFAYRPASLRLGLYLCALGAMALVVAWFQPWRWKFSGLARLTKLTI